MRQEGPLLESVIFKGTTLPHIVVRRKAQLNQDGFITYQADKNISSGKVWLLHRRATVEPQSASSIKACERHLRKAGPLRALSAYARDKNVLRLYCFRVEWPDKYAPSHGSTVELGFETLQQAREWHEQITMLIASLGGSSSNNSTAAHYRSSSSISASPYTAPVSVDPSPFTSPVSSFPSTPNLTQVSDIPADGAVSPALTDGSTATQHRHSSSDNLGYYTAHSSSSGLRGSSPSGAENRQPSSQGPATALSAAVQAQQAACARWSGRQQQQHSTTGVVVDECMMRWVPYKHANGMAIYYRQTPQEEGRGMPQASGEYMLSTAVQASPECCVSNLMLKADKNGSVLSTAAFMEVLEDNGDMQVWHMVFHPAGSAGLATVLAAPRYTFMHQVLTSYEEGVYAVLFSSVPDEDVKPEWVERANARSQRLHRAVLRSDPGSGRRKALWRTPVRCRITGAITLSALEGRSGKDSPQTLVTCIVRADFGGWLGSDSIFYSWGQALGLQEALMDRVLMRVMILKEDVEYNRFKTKPFQLLMVQAEEDDSNSNERQPQHHHHQRTPSNITHQQQLACLRFASAPPVPSGAVQGHSTSFLTGSNHLACQTPQQQPGCKSGAGNGTASASGQQQPQQPGTPTSDLMARTQIAAVQAAARVSAAASALAAHMTNPQQLWIEKRGSTAGYSTSDSPPRSPKRLHALVESLAVAPSKSSGAAAEVSASSASSVGHKPIDHPQQQRIEVNASESSPPPETEQQSLDSAGTDAFQAASAAADTLDDEAEEFTDQDDDVYQVQLQQQHEQHQPEYAQLAANGAAADQADSSSSAVQQLPYSEEQLQSLIGGSLNRRYWEPIHDGAGSVRDVYSIRGPNYLRDRKKVPAGRGRYKLMAADLVATDHMMDHIGRFLPSVRCNGAAFNFVVDLIINYGSPVLHLVMVFSTDRHPNSLGPCPDDPLDAGEEWTPFDFTMSRFLHGSDEERNGMFKLIPHCAKGSWVVSQSVGTTPVILGRKLATTYHQCDRYIEVDVDVASTQAVAYIVKMVQGATRSMLIDHAYLLESQFAHELPETLIGAIRYKHLDMTDYTYINVDQELPFSPVIPGIVGQ